MDGFFGLPGIRFNQPWALVLLALPPLVALLSASRLSGIGRARRTAAIIVRCIVIILLAIALAEPESIRKTTDRITLFLVDASQSVPRAVQQQARAFLKEAAKTARPGKDRMGVVTFARGAAIEQLPTVSLAAAPDSPPLETDATSIESALRLASVLFGPDASRRIVLLTDGNENIGTADSELSTLAANEVQVDVVPLRYQHENEVAVDAVSSPTHAKIDEAAELRASIRATRPTRGRLLVYHNDSLLKTGDAAREGIPVQLGPGANPVRIPIQFRTAGLHRFRVEFAPDDESADALSTNNVGSTATIVDGRAKALLVENSALLSAADATSNDTLVEALKGGGVEVERVDVTEASLDTASLVNTPLIILSNISAMDLSAPTQQSLVSYVRDMAGGLVVIGGDQSFSAGGYGGTVLEDALPVKTDQDKMLMMNSALVLVLDRSGSMSGDKIEMAKKAAEGTAKLLSSQDYIGVVSFDSFPVWDVPIQKCGNKENVLKRIRMIQPGGGTDMYPALAQAGQKLASVQAYAKRIIALTDGQSAPGDFLGITKTFLSKGIVTSTVAVGVGADTNLLDSIAKAGKGRFYVANTAKQIPRIFFRETSLVTRTGVYEKAFSPILRPLPGDEPIAGISPAEIPQLEGHVMTAMKPDATLAIFRRSSAGEDPILAYWQCGLGRSVAFTSGMWQKWGPKWVSWAGFSKLWTQIAIWAARPQSMQDWAITTREENGVVRVTVEADSDRAMNQSPPAMEARVIDPMQRSRSVSLRPTGIGRFEGEFPADGTGDYLVRVAQQQRDGGRSIGILQAVVSVANSAETKQLRSDEARLQEIAQKAGGRVVDLTTPDKLFEPGDVREMRTFQPIWDVFLKWSIVLFLLDVAVRRLSLSPTAAGAAIRKWWAMRFPDRVVAVPQATLSALRTTRTRVVTERNEQIRDAGPIRETPLTSFPTANATSDTPRAPRTAEPKPAPKKPPEPEVEGTDSLSRLKRLKRKRSGE
ncbi:MAG: VWA domain-containing protein [Planctomycetes bacterium]|nr:VWA domain-containing protein [Planctomycetota bacterium]